jgi:uncharacterized protein DUF5979
MVRTQLRRLGYSAGALALAVSVACVDSPISPTPNTTVLGSISAAVAVGTVEICKVTVGGDNSFVFDWSVAGGGSGSVTLSNGQCATVATGITTRTSATVTERVPPANWALTAISVVNQNDVPGGTTDVTNRTASHNVGNDAGAKFTFTNTFTPPPPPSFCTATLGFWKNHPELWDGAGEKVVLTTTTFFNSGQNYLTILGTPSAGGNAYIILAKQYIAAVLNTNGGASGNASVDAAIAGAAAYFAGAPAGIPNPVDPTRSQLLGWATTLDQFNNGVIGPGHCPD